MENDIPFAGGMQSGAPLAGGYAFIQLTAHTNLSRLEDSKRRSGKPSGAAYRG